MKPIKIEILGELYRDIQPILNFSFIETEKGNKIIPVSITSESSENVILFSANKAVNKTTVKDILDSLADIITKLAGNAESFFSNMPEALLEIFEKVQDLTNLLNLTDEQQKQIISQILDIIFEHITINIKLKGIKIPQAIVKAILKPIVISIAMSIVNWLEKIKNKPRVVASMKTKVV
jgi:hypothetical protein